MTGRGPDSELASLTWPDLLERIYPVPDPVASEEEHVRHRHWDLERLTRAELLLEAERLRLRLVLDDAPSRWLLQRNQSIGEALAHAC